jgi:tetratricopeptide (TPR) repeat protein
MPLDHKSDSAQDQLKKADQLRLAGSYDQARAILQELIKLNPFFAPAKLALGRVYFESGDLANAKSVLEEFSEFIPDHSLANKILAKIYIYFSQNAKAHEKINLVLSINPEDTMAKKMLREIEEAISFQDQALNNDDTKKNPIPANTATIAEIYRSQGHLEEALEIYKQLLQQDPSHSIYKQKIQDIEVQLNPVSQTIETKEIDPGYFKPESTIPEFRRVEVTDEKAIQPIPEVVLHEPFQPERNHSHSITAPEVEIEDFVDTLVKKNPLRKTRQEKLERMLLLVQAHRRGRASV